MLRWTDDEFSLPERLFVEIVERLYRRDEFMRGSLEIADQASLGDPGRCRVFWSGDTTHSMGCNASTPCIPIR